MLSFSQIEKIHPVCKEDFPHITMAYFDQIHFMNCKVRILNNLECRFFLEIKMWL